jgi:hypothetical protein
MFQLTESKVSCNSLSEFVTCEHANSALSSTCLQLIGGGGRPGHPGWSMLDTLGPTMLEDSGAGVASPGVSLLRTQIQVPQMTKHRSVPLASSPGFGLSQSTSMLMVPGGTSSAPGASHTSGIGSSGAGISHSTATDHGKVEKTIARSPRLMACGMLRQVWGCHRVHIGPTDDRSDQGTAPVNQASPSMFEHEQERRERYKPTNIITRVPRGHWQE